MKSKRPYSDTALARFVNRRVLDMRPKKTQIEIATQAGFVNPNMLSMIKSGAVRIPLDRVPALAAAMETDAARLLQLALEQWGGSAAARSFEAIFRTVVSANEKQWLEEIRDASDQTDPAVTTRARATIRGIFGK